MYLSAGDLIASFSKQTLVQLSNDDHTATKPNERVIEQAIQIACERIDASLRSRYRLPLCDVPTVIRSHCLYLARHWLYARRPEMAMPETVKETYNQTVKELEQIAKGILHLGLNEWQKPSDETGNLLPDVGEYAIKAPSRLDISGY